jgi:predicted phage-related endonuclease
MLSLDQIAARKGKLTASRIACLMNGDAVAILRLYQEFIGEAEPEDLSHVWPIRLGECTETLQLDWYEERNGTVSRRGEVVTDHNLPWAAATLDGWIDALNCPIECKHVGGREPFEVVVERYQPQMQWQMLVTGANECALSVIMGANEPIVEFIPFAPEYADEMVKRGTQFMKFVAQRTPPVALDPVPAPVDASKVYDMTGSNEWASSAADWLTNVNAADACRMAEKIIKAMVPADAKKCEGHGIRVTRDRAGRLSLRAAQ